VRFAIKILCSHVRTGATLITLVTCLSAAAVLCEKGMVRWSPVEDSTRTKGETSKLNSKKSAKKAKTGTREVKKQTRTGSNDEQDDKEDTRQQPLYATTNELDSGETQFGSLKEEVMQAQQELRLIYSRHNDLKSIVSAVVSGGFAEVRQQCQVKVGVPLQPMLASPSRGVEDVASHFQQFYDKHKPHPDDTSPHKSHCNPFVTAEYKYDGQRVQIHFSRVVADSSAIDGGKVESPSQNKVVLYSRNLEDVTGKFKPVCDWLLLSMPEQITSCILDAEICAVKRQKHDTTKSEQEVETHIEASILPFQVLSTMKRDDPGDLLVVSKGSQSSDGVGLCMFAFDLLLLNNEPLVDETLSIRRQKNRDAFTPMIRHGYFHFTRSIDISFSKEEIADATSQVEPFLMESIGEGRCEGLMLKSLHSTYDGISRELGGGAGSWRKLKKDYIDSLADSIDVVPIGAWRGTGRKNKWFSPFLLAVYDKSTGEWQSLCRCMSGFSDEFYQAKLDQFSPHIVPDKPDDVSTNEQAPYWFDPWKIREVWEIRGADLTLSPVHHAARGFADESFESDRGIALRFPRFIRVRDDKNIEQSSTSEDVVTLFRNQSQRQ
jgi:DNA ligase-1